MTSQCQTLSSAWALTVLTGGRNLCSVNHVCDSSGCVLFFVAWVQKLSGSSPYEGCVGFYSCFWGALQCGPFSVSKITLALGSCLECSSLSCRERLIHVLVLLNLKNVRDIERNQMTLLYEASSRRIVTKSSPSQILPLTVCSESLIARCVYWLIKYVGIIVVPCCNYRR